MNLLVLFIILNVANVIIQTVKSLATVKCGKTMAAIVNAVAYGLYQIVLVYAVCDLNLWIKVAVVAGANLVGVFVVKWIEEKTQKEKLWKVEVTIPYDEFDSLMKENNKCHIPFNYIDIEKYYIFNFYCETKEQTETLKKVLKKFKAKYFVSEAKTSAL